MGAPFESLGHLDPLAFHLAVHGEASDLSFHSLVFGPGMFGGRAWGGSQRDGFCWDEPWAASQASQPAAPAPIRQQGPLQGAGMQLELPSSRSGMAALSARHAAAEAGSAADPFSFHDAPAPGARLPPPATAATGWHNRADGFLLSDTPGNALQRGRASRHEQPPEPLAHRQPVHLPTSAPCKATFQPRVPGPAAPGTKPRGAPAAGTSQQAAVGTSGGACGPAAAPTAAPTAAPAPLATCSLTLERYLEFVQLLGKGSGRVQRLSELERAMLRATDLKQVGLGCDAWAGLGPALLGCVLVPCSCFC
jgi:hypothetical protein